jgi:hypothetical protein
MTDIPDGDGPYAVGDKHPPKHSRFRPGQSGNPAGRPKGSANLRTRVTQQLQKLVTVTKNGKPVKMPRAEVIATKLVEASMQGDLKAAKLVLQLDQEVQGHAASETALADLTFPDNDMLKQIGARLKRMVRDS